jgi:hypothetical protein
MSVVERLLLEIGIGRRLKGLHVILRKHTTDILPSGDTTRDPESFITFQREHGVYA